MMICCSIIIIGAQLLIMVLILLLVMLEIFLCGNYDAFFRILKRSKGQLLFEINIFCNIIHL